MFHKLPYGEVLLRQQLTTPDGFSQWDPASGTGISGGKSPASSAPAAGRILNPKTAENQMRGGEIMGIGQALLEGSATDPATARLVNPGLNKYLIAIHADAPPISVTFGRHGPGPGRAARVLARGWYRCEAPAEVRD